METTFNIKEGNGTSNTMFQTSTEGNKSFWTHEYTSCLNDKNVIGYSLSQQTVDLMGRKVDKMKK